MPDPAAREKKREFFLVVFSFSLLEILAAHGGTLRLSSENTHGQIYTRLLVTMIPVLASWFFGWSRHTQAIHEKGC